MFEYFCPKCNVSRDIYHKSKECFDFRCEICFTVLTKKITGGCGFIIKKPNVNSNENK